LNPDQQQGVLRAICTSGLVLGDQMQASSAFSPEFWPIHPFVDRLVQLKLLKFPFSEGIVWPEEASWKPTQKTCYGHHADDLLLSGHSPLDFNGFSGYLTNREYLEILNPMYDSGIPYIYDNFDLTFCVEYKGIDKESRSFSIPNDMHVAEKLKKAEVV